MIRALRFTGANQVRLETQPYPVPEIGEVVVAPSYVGICGTDLELLEGTMPYFAQGSASYPLQPGHEWSGVIVESADPEPPPGTRVVGDPIIGCGRCDVCKSGPATHCPDHIEMGIRGGVPGAAAEAVAVPISNLHRIPESVSLEEAVLAEPAVTVLAGLERMGPVEGRRVLVVGAGTLGLIAIQLLIARGAEVRIAEEQKSREEHAASLGALPLTDPDALSSAPGFDAVVEAAGSAAAARLAITAVASGGQVIALGIPPGPVDGFDLANVVLKDATIHGILNGPGQYENALEAIAHGELRAGEIIDAVYALEEYEAAFARLRERERPRPKVLLRLTPSP